jgi:hypothetical protein
MILGRLDRRRSGGGDRIAARSATTGGRPGSAVVLMDQHGALPVAAQADGEILHARDRRAPLIGCTTVACSS